MAGRRYALTRERSPPPPQRPSAAVDHLRRSAAAEDRIAANQREIQALVLDNQRLAATHVALKQELSAAQVDIRHLSSAAAEVKAQKDAQVRDVYARSLKLEAEVRSLDSLGPDLDQVRADVQKLTTSKLELAAKAKVVENDLIKARSELQQLPSIETEIDTMRHHIQRGRAAIEYEKKVHASNFEQSQAMEKNMVSLAQEIEKLRAELANAEKRAIAAAAAANPYPGYASGFINPTITHQSNLYTDQYQVQGSVAFVTSAPHSYYDI